MSKHYKVLALPIIIFIGLCSYLGINGFRSAVTMEKGMDSLRKLEWSLSPADLTNNYGHIEYNQDYEVFYANFTSDNFFIDEQGNGLLADSGTSSGELPIRFSEGINNNGWKTRSGRVLAEPKYEFADDFIGSNCVSQTWAGSGYCQ